MDEGKKKAYETEGGTHRRGPTHFWFSRIQSKDTTVSREFISVNCNLTEKRR